MTGLSQVRPNPSELVGEAVRIVDAVKDRGKVLRIHGAAAIFYHCPGQTELFRSMGRRPGDIDLAAYQKDSSKIADLISGLGYQEDLTVSAFGGGRLVFNRSSDGLHCDVFVGKLEMSHILRFDGRLELDYPTAPLADLLLSKLQIFKLNEKDVIDTIALLREHHVGARERETIDAGYVSDLCSKDWGLWRTVTGNLEKVAAMAGGYASLSEGDKSDVSAKTEDLQRAIESANKTLAWKLRARVGESRKWYNEVEDLYR
jgi:hypothetical protein